MKQLDGPWERRGLAGARVVIGIMWFTQLLWKLPPRFGCPPDFGVSTSLENRTSGLCDWMGLMAQHSLLPLHATFVEDVVIPLMPWSGWAVFLLESFIAVSLTLGFLTRLGALLGFLQATNLLIGLSALPHEWYWTYAMMMVLHWIFFFTAPGRTWGVDRLLVERLQPAAADGSALARGLLWAT